MDSRLEKYSEEKNLSRVSRNSELYKEINNNELDNFSVKSNATVIGNQEPEIDIEKIKKILDTKYKEGPKRKSIRIEPTKEESRLLDDTPTKEYDINVILEKAKDEKEETYEEVRAKKLRNTQFDILNNLNIKEPKEEIEKNNSKKAEEDLIELINTITINESKKKAIEEERELDPLNILEDLKGDEGTAVYEKMVEEVTNTNLEKAEEQIKENQKAIDNSFYTNNLFKKKDFEEDNNEFNEDEKLNIWIKILIVLVIILFLAGIFLFLKSFLKF